MRRADPVGASPDLSTTARHADKVAHRGMDPAHPPGRQEPPAAYRGPSNVTDGDGSTIPHPAYTVGDLDAWAEAIRGRYVVEVAIGDGTRTRTYWYANVRAAERCVERARKRGAISRVALVQTIPVGVVSSLTYPAAKPADLAACVWCGGVTTSTDAEPMHSICQAAAATRGGAA